MADLKAIIKKQYPRIIFIIVGAIGGFLYWKFVGCESGTCRIKSVWYWSTLYGGIFGYLIGDIILGLIKRKSKEETE